MVEKLLHNFGFEKLDVWNSSIELSKLVYDVTNSFPTDEKYGLVSQIRRAVVSISSNIAEGSSKASLKDQARFSEIAYGSLMEVLNQIIIAKNFGYISQELYLTVRNEIEKVSRQLNAYKNSQIRRSDNDI
jgi:four helix bundle protein